jgi:hypothetical protein
MHSNSCDCTRCYLQRLEEAQENLIWLEKEGHDLRSENVPTGGDDYEIQWRVVAHYMRAPRERIISYGRTIKEAIQQARNEPLDVGPA